MGIRISLWSRSWARVHLLRTQLSCGKAFLFQSKFTAWQTLTSWSTSDGVSSELCSTCSTQRKNAEFRLWVPCPTFKAYRGSEWRTFWNWLTGAKFFRSVHFCSNKAILWLTYTSQLTPPPLLNLHTLKLQRTSKKTCPVFTATRRRYSGIQGSKRSATIRCFAKIQLKKCAQLSWKLHQRWLLLGWMTLWVVVWCIPIRFKRIHWKRCSLVCRSLRS